MEKSNAWDATYDTIVLGFGGAGATAARFAADAGAHVLIVDSAPNGHEGGNTRYAAQLLGTSDNFEETKKYYKALTYPMNLDEEMIDTYVRGMTHMRDYVRNYLNVEPISTKENLLKDKHPSALEKAVHEYPEYPGAESFDYTTVHHGMFDSALWQILRQKVLDRSSLIDVWLSSAAKHLIQDSKTKTITGALIHRNNHDIRVQARNGVVLSVGGFENNPQAIQDYLGVSQLPILGSLYNQGDGIRMAEEVGADLWHMNNYESLGFLCGMSFKSKTGNRARLNLTTKNHLYSGSIMTIADDGSRYFREDEPNRHGKLYDHGTWRMPKTAIHPHLLFDKTQYEQFRHQDCLPYTDFLNDLISAPTLSELAVQINVDANIVKQTVNEFNTFADQGVDYAFHRDPQTMRKFDDGPYYAIELTHVILNTQGGPRRNARAQILDTNQEPIPHLFGAGELGGISTNQYQAGCNLAECLIFGKIAGENAAKPSHYSSVEAKETAADATSSASQKSSTPSTNNNDLLNTTSNEEIPLKRNQYLGISNTGIGGEVVARVTYADEQLTDVEIIRQSETSEIGGQAVSELPKRMVAENTFDVDAVTGASVSSHAIKEAVKNAILQATNTVVK
ncbi:MAG TPA: FAD-binding dehydrogenase [Lactobacillus sp.]|nr:FAD-binding dehydrogenase [Lactobacillus sp.]